MGEHRADQAAAAETAELDRLGAVVVGHQGAGGPERLDVVDLGGLQGAVAVQQHRAEEGPRNPLQGLPAKGAVVAVDHLACAGEGGDPLAHLRALRPAGKRPHSDPRVVRVADHHLVEAPGEGIRDRGHQGAGHDGAADRRALLPCLGRHLPRHLLDVELELGRPGRRVGTEQRRVEGVGLHGESDAVSKNGRVPLERQARGRRPGEADRVLALQVVEQVPDTAADQLQRPFREQAGLHHAPEHPLREVGRLAGGLDDGGHPRDQGRTQLLQHPPAGKVECVDVDGGPLQGDVDVLADETAFAGEGLGLAVDVQVGVGHLPAPLAGVGEERPYAPLDVRARVGARRARGPGERVELLLVLQQVPGQRLQPEGPLVGGQAPQRGAADPPRMIQHRGEVDAATGDLGDRSIVRRVAKQGRFVRTAGPRTLDVTLQTHRLFQGGSPSVVQPAGSRGTRSQL